MTIKQQHSPEQMNTRTDKLDLAQFEGHSPEPWEWHEDGAIILSGDGSFVCTMSDLNLNQDGELLVAAPALLAECKRQREQIAALREALQAVTRAIIPLASGRRFTAERRAAVEQARAALKVKP